MARWFLDPSHERGIPWVSLRRLMPEARFVGCRDIEASGCTRDSRHLEPGQAYVAIGEGAEGDQHARILQALDRGASCVILDRPSELAGPLQVIVPDPRLAHARLAHALAGDPALGLRVVVVVGQRGAAAAIAALGAIAERQDRRFGSITPESWSDGTRLYPATRVLDSPEALAEMLAAMSERGCREVAIQVEPGQLCAGVLVALPLRALIVADLDEPACPDARRALSRLVRQVETGGQVVVPVDRPSWAVLGGSNLDAACVTYSASAGLAGDVTGSIGEAGRRGWVLRLVADDCVTESAVPLLGGASVRGVTAAAAWTCAGGVPLPRLAAWLDGLPCVAGSLEPIEAGQPFGVWLDRVRTPEELAESLCALARTRCGRIACVLAVPGVAAEPFDARSWAAVVSERAGAVVLTIDGAATSEALDRLEALRGCFPRPGRVRVEPDRAAAVQAAMSIAGPDDAVLLAGRAVLRRIVPRSAGRPLVVEDEPSIVRRWWLSRVGGTGRRSA